MPSDLIVCRSGFRGSAIPCVFFGGDERTRTADPLLAKQVLYQLSYNPKEHS